MTKPPVKLLIVDDEFTVRINLSAMIAHKFNFEIYTASSVDEAVDLFDAIDIDIVVTDFSMPDKSGLDLITHIKKNNLLCKIIVFTVYPCFPDVFFKDMNNFVGVVKKHEPEKIFNFLNAYN